MKQLLINFIMDLAVEAAMEVIKFIADKLSEEYMPTIIEVINTILSYLL